MTDKTSGSGRGDVIPIAEAKKKRRRKKKDDRHPILLSTHEKQIADEVIAVLAERASLYHRGGWLVQVLEERSRSAQATRKPRARIRPLPAPTLQEYMSEHIRFERASWVEKDGHKEQSARPVHPPAWCVRAVHSRGDWQGISRLHGIADYPVYLGEGRVLIERGYDAASEVFQCYRGPKILLPDQVSKDQAIEAAYELRDLTCDFPFLSEIHRSGWLAAALTPAARFSFEGAAPLFMCDGNTPGCGKGKLMNIIPRIYIGRNFSCTPFPRLSDEWSKLMTTYAMNGAAWLLFDNISGAFGDANLDAVLTNPFWECRMLGGNQVVSEPILLTFYVTGNNIVLKGDLPRRTCHIRLESPLEHPEARTKFVYPKLLQHVTKRRAHYMACLLKMLLAYDQAGRPPVSLSPWGSFEEWSDIVRSVIVWLGFPDPGESYVALQKQSDPEREDMEALLNFWEQIQPGRGGMTTNEFWQELFTDPTGKLTGDGYQEARHLVEGLCYKAGPRSLGKHISKFRGRVFGGLKFVELGEVRGSKRWYAALADETLERR